MKYLTLLLTALAVPWAACGSSGSTARRYDDLVNARDREYDIRPESEILRACGLDASRSYFSYASSDLSSDDRALLGDIGHCMTSGRLAGRSILVTGFTSAEGTAGSNQELGMARAREVAATLAERGIYTNRIFVRSRGEDRATGDDAAGRALDRKVDLQLVERN